MKKEQISKNERLLKEKQILGKKQSAGEGVEHLLNALGEVDEKYIAEAAPSKDTGNKTIWLRRGALATCAALALFVGIRYLPSVLTGGNPGLPDSAGGNHPGGLSENIGGSSAGNPAESGTGSSADLPLLTISGESSESMGYEGYMAYDISDLINANPWNETAELSTLPVYRNLHSPWIRKIPRSW